MIRHEYPYLDSIERELENDPHMAMTALTVKLSETRNLLSDSKWKRFATDASSHSLANLTLLDPFTKRSVEKPRGYAGDAELIDMIYDFDPKTKLSTDDIGRHVFQFTINSPAPVAVRDRRVRMAEEIQRAIQKQLNPRILSVACGHLRELDLVDSLDACDITGLDQDSQSLRFANERFPCIKTLPLSVKEILRGENRLGQFDLIYSSGLYDYFSQPMGQRVTERLFSMLNPGGRLVIANFAPTIRDVGYMECFMDWWLIYRTAGELEDLAKNIPDSSISHIQIESRCDGDILYLTLQSI